MESKSHSNQKLGLRTTAGILVLLCGGISQAATAGIETFDTDAAGFVANTTSSVVIWAASEGNPDGHIQTRKDMTAPVFDTGALTTAADFTGDYASDGVTGATVDLMAAAGNVDTAWLRFRRDVFTNGWRYPLTNSLSPNDGWATYDVTFDPTWNNADALGAGWLMDQDVDPVRTQALILQTS